MSGSMSTYEQIRDIALERILLDKKSGVPQDAMRWMTRRWLSDIVDADLTTDAVAVQVGNFLDDNNLFAS